MATSGAPGAALGHPLQEVARELEEGGPQQVCQRQLAGDGRVGCTAAETHLLDHVDVVGGSRAVSHHLDHVDARVARSQGANHVLAGHHGCRHHVGPGEAVGTAAAAEGDAVAALHRPDLHRVSVHPGANGEDAGLLEPDAIRKLRSAVTDARPPLAGDGGAALLVGAPPQAEAEV